MRKYLVAAGLIAIFAVGLAACSGVGGTGSGGSSGSGSTLSLGGTDFTGATTITITAGQAVTFDDSSGGTHDLVTGTGGKFAAATGAPSEFASSDGLDLHPGDKITVMFKNAGTYQITCTIHPSMQAKIVVQAASGYGY
jgi:plastocyanin